MNSMRSGDTCLICWVYSHCTMQNIAVFGCVVVLLHAYTYAWDFRNSGSPSSFVMHSTAGGQRAVQKSLYSFWYCMFEHRPYKTIVFGFLLSIFVFLGVWVGNQRMSLLLPIDVSLSWDKIALEFHVPCTLFLIVAAGWRGQQVDIHHDFHNDCGIGNSILLHIPLPKVGTLFHESWCKCLGRFLLEFRCGSSCQGCTLFYLLSRRKQFSSNLNVIFLSLSTVIGCPAWIK